MENQQRVGKLQHNIPCRQIQYGLGTHNIAETHYLTGYASVFHAEALAILAARNMIRNIVILTDSQDTIKALW